VGPGSDLKPARPTRSGAFASLVDKQSGDILWCNRLAKPVADLREAESARQAVKALLERFPR
jgi:hypothetical protein